MRKGWEIKKLGEVCNVIGGGTPSKAVDEFYKGEIPWATVRDMRSEIITNTEFRITSEAVTKSSTNIIPKGNVVIATRVGLGKVCLIENDTAINQDLRGIVPIKKSIAVKYLFWWLKSISQKIIDEGTGATVQGVKLPFIKSLPIPIPPPADQHRIVSILDEAFEAIDQAKANTEKNLQNARELFQSELNSIFTNKGEGWVEKRIDEVSRVVNGFAFKSPDFSPKNIIKSVKITNVGVKEFVEEQDNFLPEGYQHKYIDFQVRHDDIVVALTRTIISSGLKVAKVPLSYDGALINQRVAAIVPNEKIIKSNLLYSFMCSDIVANYVTANVNTLMQPNLSINDLRRLQVPVPPLKDQHSITEKLDSLSLETKQLEENYRKKLESLEELKKSILQKAFSGELTSPERVASDKDGCSPSNKKGELTSPERV
jgi:type I restriction enzyme S subunit